MRENATVLRVGKTKVSRCQRGKDKEWRIITPGEKTEGRGNVSVRMEVGKGEGKQR